MRRSACVALLLALAMGACTDADGDVAERTVREFVAALERGDGRAACERLGDAGTSELLLTALEVGTSADGLNTPGTDRCALLASRLASGEPALAALARAPVIRTSVEGDRATVWTRAGAYEAEERDGRWLVSGFEPVARAVTGRPVSRPPVHLSVVRPKLREAALGPARAGRVKDEDVELSGTLDPPDADLDAEATRGASIERAEAGDGRFRVRLRLRPGPNDVLLTARAPGREPTERPVRLTLE